MTFSVTVPGIHSDLLSDQNSGILSDIYSDILSEILTVEVRWGNTAIGSSRLRSGGEHSHRELAVEVR